MDGLQQDYQILLNQQASALWDGHGQIDIYAISRQLRASLETDACESRLLVIFRFDKVEDLGR